MTGLEKILAEIRSAADAEAAQTLAAAQAKAEHILAKAQELSMVQAAALAAQTDAQVKEMLRSSESAVILQRRQRVLAQKQMLLNETLDAALNALYQLPESDYFDLLCRLAAGMAEPGAGRLWLNERDYQRKPADFERRLAAALPDGAALTIRPGERPLDGGFVLQYGDLEQNCSFKALFDSRRDEFADLIQSTLFGS